MYGLIGHAMHSVEHFELKNRTSSRVDYNSPFLKILKWYL